jgi:hypothetical protein
MKRNLSKESIYPLPGDSPLEEASIGMWSLAWEGACPESELRDICCSEMPRRGKSEVTHIHIISFRRTFDIFKALHNEYSLTFSIASDDLSLPKGRYVLYFVPLAAGLIEMPT